MTATNTSPTILARLYDARRTASQAASDLQTACVARKLRLAELDRVARHASLMIAELRIAIQAVNLSR